MVRMVCKALHFHLSNHRILYFSNWYVYFSFSLFSNELLQQQQNFCKFPVFLIYLSIGPSLQDWAPFLSSSLHHLTLKGLLTLIFPQGLNVRDSDGRSPLMWAVWEGKEQIVSQLIEVGRNNLLFMLFT